MMKQSSTTVQAFIVEGDDFIVIDVPVAGRVCTVKRSPCLCRLCAAVSQDRWCSGSQTDSRGKSDTRGNPRYGYYGLWLHQSKLRAQLLPHRLE